MASELSTTSTSSAGAGGEFSGDTCELSMMSCVDSGRDDLCFRVSVEGVAKCGTCVDAGRGVDEKRGVVRN